MSSASETKCPGCGGTLSDTQGQSVVRCPYCGTDVRIQLTAAESMAAIMNKRRALEPAMNALMDHYASLLGAGQKTEAMVYYEAFTYLTLVMSYEVQELHELEAMATPLLEDTARQLDISYHPPKQRGTALRWAHVDRLAGLTIER
ncbi:MAG: hypothetical protein AAFY60_10500 [Myxococcota bacterium]